jgi:hypothetical protein
MIKRLERLKNTVNKYMADLRQVDDPVQCCWFSRQDYGY